MRPEAEVERPTVEESSVTELLLGEALGVLAEPGLPYEDAIRAVPPRPGLYAIRGSAARFGSRSDSVSLPIIGRCTSARLRAACSAAISRPTSAQAAPGHQRSAVH